MKPRIGFFDFTGCEGCQLSVLNLEERLLELLSLVEIVEFREIQDGTAERLDVAFVEGSITRPEEEQRLHAIRAKSTTLVALGACADLAGINALRGAADPAELSREVYGSAAPHLVTGPPRPLDAVVPVDHRIPGCPVNPTEFLQVLQALLLGKPPELPGFAVCVECKLAELPCTFERGVVCLGPVTRAGCAALCVAGGDRCRGCRGLVDNPREAPYRRILEENGLTVKRLLAEYRLFNLRRGEES